MRVGPGLCGSGLFFRINSLHTSAPPQVYDYIYMLTLKTREKGVFSAIILKPFVYNIPVFINPIQNGDYSIEQ